MKILITGANGLLGQKLIELLQDQQDVDLIATARKPLSVTLRHGEFVSLDVTDLTSVENVITQTNPDRIIHTAAMTQVDQCEVEKDECWKNNVTALANLVKVIQGRSIHLTHVSTDFIFDGSQGPLDETAIPRPLSHYGASKLAAEEILMKSDIPWAIVRTILVYGITSDMSRSNIVLWVKKSLEEKKTIQVVNDQFRTPTLAEDLAMGCALASRIKAQGIYHVSGEELMTPYDIAVRTAAFFQLDASLIQSTDSTRFTQPARRPLRTGFIIDKAKRDLGYVPHSFEEGLAILKAQIKARS